jgi:hypothetical protein
MTFLHPWLLAGLLAAGVPLLLHLVQRREPPTVVFPAVRYLLDATREHQRRLRIRHWLLLLLRTLLVVALVLAAAGPTVARSGVTEHAPGALVLVVDNSLSSAAVAGGTPRLDQLVRAAEGVLARATPADAVWLIVADGAARRGDPATLRAALRELRPSTTRLDLGRAVVSADEVLAGEPLRGEIVVVTDLQASALGAAAPRAPLTVARPEGAIPRNVGIVELAAGSQPWSTDGGLVQVRVAGDSGAQAPLSLTAGDRPARQALAAVGGAVQVAVPGAAAGWYALAATIQPDELRLDDRRVLGLRMAPLARATCAPAGRFAEAACDVLRANGRLLPGDDIVLGGFGSIASVVLPPADPASLGAVNRELERRGVAWHFGEVALAGATDSSAILPPARLFRRLRLVPSGSGRTGVLLTTAGEPWLVRSGSVLLVGSRLDTGWTALPFQAEFVPFIDVLLNRLARGEVASLDVVAGDAGVLPDLVSAVVKGAERWPVEGGGRFAPPDTGLYFLLRGTDTVGALASNPDPRESMLQQASDAQVRALWPGAQVVPLDQAASAAFAAGARGDLRGPLLWLALALGLAEVGLASVWGRRA